MRAEAPRPTEERWSAVLADGSVTCMVAEIMTEKNAPPGKVSRYDGEMDELRKCWHGRGMFSSWSGRVFDGCWHNGSQSSFALVTYENGDFYEGGWQSGSAKAGIVHKDEWGWGVRAGFGVMVRANGDCYEGLWLRDEEHGMGIALYAAGGEVCVGEYARGVRDGHGILYYLDGTVYDGGWRRGQQSGMGVVLEPLEEVHEGEEDGHVLAQEADEKRHANGVNPPDGKKSFKPPKKNLSYRCVCVCVHRMTECLFFPPYVCTCSLLC